MPEKKAIAEQQAAKVIADLLPDARQDIDMIPILAARDEVLAQYGVMFQPEAIAELSLRQYRDFLKFENNKHWTGLVRRGYEVKDIGRLREALALLVDEREPLASRFDRAIAQAPGLTPAIAATILHVAHPTKYAPWNRTSARALAQLRLKTRFSGGATEGEKYAAVNALLLRFAGEVNLHLWDLDAVFQYLISGPAHDEEMEALEIRPSLNSILTEMFALQQRYPFSETSAAMRKRGVLVSRIAPKFMTEYINPLRFPNYQFEYEGFNGQGDHGKIPYFRIHSPEAASEAPPCSLVYLFAADGSAAYLSLNCERLGRFDDDGGIRPTRQIRERVQRARAFLIEKGFRARDLRLDITLQDPQGQAARVYEEGNIFAIEYCDPLPDESVLHEDLSDMLSGLYSLSLANTAPAAPASGLQYEVPRPATNALVRETQHAMTEEPKPTPRYTVDQCAEETGVARDTLAAWLRAIERKGQAILYGPPGTGKTFAAQRLAKVLTSESDGFIELVQFHPSYAYEDFIYGIRPTPGPAGTLHLEAVPGRFVNFCERARGVQGKCVLIIDEINRANLARVFGEMMYLLEYRQETIEVAIGKPFSIPSNVFIIGTMNTADRSIAVVDHALRRRFAFCALTPNYETLRAFHRGSNFPVERLIHLLGEINDAIEDPHYHIGISYFMRTDLPEHLQDIWTVEIEPYLEEFFFDQPQIVTSYRWPQIRSRIFHG